MHKSTIILAGCCIVLATLTVVVGTHAWRARQATVGGAISGAQIDLGLPDQVRKEGDEEFDAVSAVLYEAKSGRILFEQNGFERRPVASITKLMTAIVAFDEGIDWDKEVQGIGPAAEDRVDPELIRQIARDQGLSEIKNFRAGQYHFGMVFSKV